MTAREHDLEARAFAAGLRHIDDDLEELRARHRARMLDRLELELVADDVERSAAWARRARRDADRRRARRAGLFVAVVGLAPFAAGVLRYAF